MTTICVRTAGLLSGPSIVRSLSVLLPLQPKLADLAVASTVVAVACVFLISPITLEVHGVAYLSSGGGLFSKFHPATFIAAAAIGLRAAAADQPLYAIRRILTKDPGVVLMSAAVIVSCLFAVFIAKTPVTPLVDTFVLPIAFFVLLRDLNPAIRRALALLIVAILTLNSILGIIEYLQGWHFITIPVPQGVSFDPTRGDQIFSWQAELSQDWRAMALLGHPLVNGLVTGCFLVCLAAPGTRWLPLSVKAVPFLLGCISLFAFGARTAMVFSFAFAGVLVLRQALEAWLLGRRPTPRQTAIALICFGLAILAIVSMDQAGFFERMMERFGHDHGSAETRLTMFALLQSLSMSDLILGPDKGLIATLQKIYGLEFGIESSWIGLLLTYGLVVTTIIISGLAAFSRSVVNAGGRGTLMVLLLYYIAVSVAATLSGKTTTLAMIIVLVMVFLQKNEETRPLRSILRMEPV